MSKKKIITIISILYWGILIYSAISGVITELAEEGITLTNLSYIESLPKEELMGFIGIVVFLTASFGEYSSKLNPPNNLADNFING